MKLFYFFDMIFFTLFTLFSACSASNILLLFPMSPKSHVNAFVPLFKKLSENGHNLTIVSPFSHTTPIQNCSYIRVRNVLEEMINERAIDVEEFRKITESTITWPFLRQMQLELAEKFLENGGLRELMEGNYQFDLVISEILYMFELFVAFGHVYNAPVISIDAHPPSAWSSYLTGNVHPYSYVPNFRISVTDQMSFIERLQNTLFNLEEILVSLYYMPKQERLMQKYLSYNGKYDFPPLLDMLHNTSLTLVDAHFSYGYVRPYLPNIVEVGGLTSHHGGELNEEFQQFLDESEKGLIYFTFGSIINTTFFPPEVIDIFLSTFRQLEQNVIMKWEADTLPNKPKNVKTAKWLPQNGILAHPNCRLFITHGGIHGLTEAMFHKVPLVVLPFASDQFSNALFAEREGFAYILNNNNLTTKNLLYAIKTAFDNPEFKKNVERRSAILKDKDQDSLDKALYWVEYVIRHKGAKHLRPASLNLNIFQYFLFDVISAIIFTILGCLLLVFFFLRIIVKCIKPIIMRSKQKKD